MGFVGQFCEHAEVKRGFVIANKIFCKINWTRLYSVSSVLYREAKVWVMTFYGRVGVSSGMDKENVRAIAQNEVEF